MRTVFLALWRPSGVLSVLSATTGRAEGLHRLQWNQHICVNRIFFYGFMSTYLFKKFLFFNESIYFFSVFCTEKQLNRALKDTKTKLWFSVIIRFCKIQICKNAHCGTQIWRLLLKTAYLERLYWLAVVCIKDFKVRCWNCWTLLCFLASVCVCVATSVATQSSLF